ncbi:MAG: cation-transporting P-type ATPase, partial [Sulfuricurvum sp.]|nr:cation-transporting P-type ATPase [Sulfuricurvum sp.]
MIGSAEAPHSKSPEELYLLLHSSPSGIEAASALSRQRLYGRNLLTDEQRSFLAIFISQFKSPIVAILIAAALLSLAMGHTTDSMIIIG